MGVELSALAYCILGVHRVTDQAQFLITGYLVDFGFVASETGMVGMEELFRTSQNFGNELVSLCYE